MKILVAPLDWGLGHATRCIPVISELIRQGHEVIIAADGNTGNLLKLEFPETPFIFLRGYRIKYASFLPMSLTMMLQAPKILTRIFIEHYQLRNIVKKHAVERVISDNRFGLWNKKIHSIFITHQLLIKCPAWLQFLEPTLHSINKLFIRKFDECWIPDDEKMLSGKLSRHFPLPSNAKFIGLLSRWNPALLNFSNKVYDLVAVVSGPEPHRSAFEKMLISKLSLLPYNSLIIQGKPGEFCHKKINPRLEVVSHLKSNELLELISLADWVICRPGYSSIMDLVSIQKDAILIPTPGQTEQIYLAEYLKQRNVFFSMKQQHFNPEAAIRESRNYSVKI